IPIESLRPSIGTPKHSKGSADAPPLSISHPLPDNYHGVLDLEKRIFCAIMHNMELLQGEDREYFALFLSSPFRDIIQILNEAQANTPSVSFVQFFDHL